MRDTWVFCGSSSGSSRLHHLGQENMISISPATPIMPEDKSVLPKGLTQDQIEEHIKRIAPQLHDSKMLAGRLKQLPDTLNHIEIPINLITRSLLTNADGFDPKLRVENAINIIVIALHVYDDMTKLLAENNFETAFQEVFEARKTQAHDKAEQNYLKKIELEVREWANAYNQTVSIYPS